MKNVILKVVIVALTLSSALFTTGCTSGGYKLTRQYSSWVNSQQVIIRVVLFLLTMPVYIVTLLIDLVVFNTVDFWEGRVSQGTYNFEKDGQQYFVKHEYQGKTKLRKTTIRTMSLVKQKVKEIVLLETQAGEIELYMDGKLRQKAESLSEFPIITKYDQDGQMKSHMPMNLSRRLLAGSSSKPREL